MAIPNTTQTPNIIFNGLMAQMSDTEFRVVMAVVRGTLGWELDNKTGMRKHEDWLTNRRLQEITGRSDRALSSAIENSIQEKWIEARDREGNLLDTKDKRSGKKIFYRLGSAILLQNDEKGIIVKTFEKSSKVKKTFENSSIENSSNDQRNTITKDIIISKDIIIGKKINNLIDLFQYINPSFRKLFANKTQRKSLEDMVKLHSYEKMEKIIKILPQTNKMKFFPAITTPLELEDKIGKLIIQLNKIKSNKPVIVKIK